MSTHMIYYNHKQQTNKFTRKKVQNYEGHEQSISRVEAVFRDEERT